MNNKFAQVDQIVDTTKKILDKGEEVAGSDAEGTPKAESPVDFANKINQGEESGAAMFAGYGLSREDYEGSLQALKSAGMTHEEAIQYLNEVGVGSAGAGSSPKALLPLAVAVYTRVRPDAARATAIMGTLAQFESEFPGLGVFDTAMEAAMGKPVFQHILRLRMALWGSSDDSNANYNASKPLEQAITGIALPKSEMGALLDDFNMARQKRKQEMEGLHLQMARYLSVYGAEAEKAAAGIIRDLNAKLPGFASGMIGNQIFRWLTTIGTASGLWKGMKSSAGLGAPTSGQGGAAGGFIRNPRSAQVLWPTREAQVAPEPEGSPVTPSSGLTPTDEQTQSDLGVAQNVSNDSNKQQSSGAYDSILQTAPTAAPLQNQWLQKMRLAEERKQLYDTKRKIITTMSTHDSAYDASASPQTPAITPDKLEAVARELSQIAAEGEAAANEALKLQTQLDSLSGSNSLNPAEMTGRQQARARMEQILSEMIKNKREALELVIVGPIMQQIMIMRPYKDQMSAEIEYGKEVYQGIGNDEFVLSFYTICEEMGNLYEQAANRFAQVLQSAQSPDLATFASTSQQQYVLLAKQSRLEARRAVAELTGQITGGKMAEKLRNSLVKLAQDAPKEDMPIYSDEETETYWNDLLPGYGTKLEHPTKPTKKYKMRFKRKCD